jgi:hypothetical protein
MDSFVFSLPRDSHYFNGICPAEYLGFNPSMEIFYHFLKGGFLGHFFFDFFDGMQNGRMILPSKFIPNFKKGGVG